MMHRVFLSCLEHNVFKVVCVIAYVIVFCQYCMDIVPLYLTHQVGGHPDCLTLLLLRFNLLFCFFPCRFIYLGKLAFFSFSLGVKLLVYMIR